MSSLLLAKIGQKVLQYGPKAFRIGKKLLTGASAVRAGQKLIQGQSKDTSSINQVGKSLGVSGLGDNIVAGRELVGSLAKLKKKPSLSGVKSVLQTSAGQRLAPKELVEGVEKVEKTKKQIERIGSEARKSISNLQAAQAVAPVSGISALRAGYNFLP